MRMIEAIVKLKRKTAKRSNALQTMLCLALVLLLGLQSITSVTMANGSKSSGSRNSGKQPPLPETPQTPTLDSIDIDEAIQGQAITVTLHGSNTKWQTTETRATFGPEISVGGAAAGELGPVTVINTVTATAQITVSQTASLGPRTVRVFTDEDDNSGDEEVLLVEGFTVKAFAPPGLTAWSVATVAGEAGTSGFADGEASQARFNNPAGIATDEDDAIYVADAGNHRIRKVRDELNGGVPVLTVSTLAGDGTAGFQDGAANQARFNNPHGVAVDSTGVVYVADTGNHRIRRIATDGTVSTFARDGTAGFQNGSGSQARFNSPRGLVIDKTNNIWVADSGNHAVRMITSTGTVTTVAGNGQTGSNDSPNARFNNPTSLTTDPTGVFVYVTDADNHKIRKVVSAGTVTTTIGIDRGFADGKRALARFADPSAISIDSSGKLIVADTTNSLVRIVDTALAASGEPGAVITRAGTGERGDTDGAGNQAKFFTPKGIAATSIGTVIVADTGNHTLRRILRPPTITSFSPTQAAALSAININGTNFDASSLTRNIVKFTKSGGGQTQAQVSAASASQLTVTIPSDAVTGPVSVQTEGGIALSPTSFIVIGSSPAPFITSFSPTHGPPGTTVTLLGDSLTAQTGSTTVTFATNSGPRIQGTATLATQTEVRAVVPTGAVTGTIEVTNALGTASSVIPFIVDPPQQNFQINVAPSTVQAVQGTTAIYVVSLTSALPNFTQLATLSTTGVPMGVVVTFEPAQITAGATSTLKLNLASAQLATNNYQFTIRATASINGVETVRTAQATLSVIAGGQTSLSGRVLSTDKEPVIGATISLDGKSTLTDAAGSFRLTGINAGNNRPLMINGLTASAPNRTYPVITEPANVVAGQSNVVPFIFYLPVIDTANEVIVVPTQTTVVTTPKIPGAKVVIPANANLRNRDGSPVVAVSITSVPQDRTPTPLPANVSPAVVFTIQPGGAVADVPMTISYPNLTGANPGTVLDLYAFNHDTVVWDKYGTGQVSADGRTVEPQINPATGQPYGLTTFAWHFVTPPPPGTANPEGNTSPNDSYPCSQGSNPVDFASGMKIEGMADIVFGGARGGIAFGRVYTSDLALSNIVGRFGRGTRDNYDIRLTGTWQQDGAGRLIMPSEATGRLFNYLRTDPDGALVFSTGATVSQLGDVIRKLTNGTFEHRLADGSMMRFNSSGNLTSLVDRNQNTTTLSYTGGNLTEITDPVGRSVAFDYDGSNRIISATDPLDREWEYTYDGSGRLATVDDPDPLGGTYVYAYNQFHLLTSVTDKRGNVVKQIVYDANGRVASQQFVDGGTETYVYTLSGRRVSETTITDPLGRRHSMRFDAKGYVIEQTDPLGQVSRTERDVTSSLPLSTIGPCGCPEMTRTFDERGNVTSVTDRLSQTTEIEYEPVFNNVTKITDKLDRETTFGYDTHGNLTSITNALNQTTTFEYDQFGQLTAVVDALGHRSELEYDNEGNVTAKEDALSNRSTFEYDDIGRLTTALDPLSRSASIAYDAMDRVISATDPANATTSFVYDRNGNQLSATNAVNQTWSVTYDTKNRPVSSADPLNRIARVEYNRADEATAVFSPTNRSARYAYDIRGQLLTMTDAIGGIVRFSYDNRGNLIAVKDQRGNSTNFTYDELFRPVATTDQIGRIATVSYDSMDNVVESIDRLGRRTTYTYDFLHRPTQVVYQDATVTIGYDTAGRVASINDTTGGTVEWIYDNANRVLSETTPQGTVSYGYNTASQVTSMTAGNRPAVSYGYDTAGRLQTITQGSEAFTFGYDTLSRRSSLQRPNGIMTSYNYDQVSRLTRLLHQDSQSQPVEDFQYGYNLDDEIETLSSLHTSQLMSAEKNYSTANAANRITQAGQTTLSHDDEGQTVTSATSQGVTGYEWDARGRLKRAVLPNGQPLLEFASL